MRITVTRDRSTPEGTPGTLTTEQGFTCKTLELPWENNRKGISCILPDVYNASIIFSPHFNHEVVRLEDKHNRQDCEIHNGNFASLAEGEVTQIHGCTEVGKGYSQIDNNLGRLQFGIIDSMSTLILLLDHIKTYTARPDGGYDDFSVEYKWGDGCQPDDMTDLNGG